MKLTLTSFVSALIVSQLSFATPSFLSAPVAVRCPEVRAIINVGIKEVELVNDNAWGTMVEDQFATDHTWIFVITKLKADNEADAIIKLKELLPTLRFVDGPHNKSRLLTCNYAIKDAVAVAWSVAQGDEYKMNYFFK